MTTIVMKVAGGDVIAGWDSQSTNGSFPAGMVSDKVWVQGGLVYGVAGALRTSDAIQAIDFPPYDGSDPRRWLIRVWVPAFRDAVKDDPILFDAEEGCVKHVQILVVVGGEVFDIDSSLSPSQDVLGVYSIGSGAPYAMGALRSGSTVVDALSIAASCDVYTGGDLTATSVKVLLKEAFEESSKYRIVLTRADDPSTNWQFVVDRGEVEDLHDFKYQIGDMLNGMMEEDMEARETDDEGLRPEDNDTAGNG